MLKTAISYYTTSKPLVFLSGAFGIMIESTVSIINENTPEQIFGITFSLWIIAGVVLAWNYRTGLKAAKYLCKKQPEIYGEFVFENEKAWRVFEKAFMFTLIIAFIYFLEKEVLRLELPEYINSFLTICKIGSMFYAILIEFKSVGDNHFKMYKKKARMFKIIDNVISITETSFYKKLNELIGNGED